MRGEGVRNCSWKVRHGQFIRSVVVRQFGSKRIFTGENWRGRRFVWKNIWRQRRARLIVAVNIYPEGNFLWPGERKRERRNTDEGSWKARLFELFLSYLRALTREHEVSLYYTRRGCRDFKKD